MMRNLLSIFFLSTFLLCTAQTKTYVGLKFGGLGSTSYMNHSVLPVVMKINWLPGATGGLQVMHFSEKFESKVNFGIQTGVNITGKGWVQRFEGIKNHKTRINYLEIPLEAVGYFGNKNKYFVTAGFFMEYALSAETDPLPEGAIVNEDYPELYDVGEFNFHPYDFKTDNRLNYGPRGSAGVFREMKSGGALKLEGFFTFSIRSTYDYEPIESGIPDLALNYTAGFTVGYFFSFGKLEI